MNFIFVITAHNEVMFSQACVKNSNRGGGVGAVGGGRVWQGGMHGRGHSRQGVWVPPWQILRDTVNEQSVRILLECILVRIVWSFMSSRGGSRIFHRGTPTLQCEMMDTNQQGWEKGHPLPFNIRFYNNFAKKKKKQKQKKYMKLKRNLVGGGGQGVRSLHLPMNRIIDRRLY